MTKREIKFRAWINNKMDYDPSGSECCGEFSPINYPIEEIQKKGGVVMQFTGLLDKRGKEIYEGDVVKGGIVVGYSPDGDCESLVSPTQVFEEVVAVVVWDSCRLTYKLKRKKGERAVFMPSLFEIEDAEVIGNIYSTPELLEKQ